MDETPKIAESPDVTFEPVDIKPDQKEYPAGMTEESYIQGLTRYYEKALDEIEHGFADIQKLEEMCKQMVSPLGRIDMAYKNIPDADRKIMKDQLITLAETLLHMIQLTNAYQERVRTYVLSEKKEVIRHIKEKMEKDLP